MVLWNLDLENFNWNNLDKNQKVELGKELANFLKKAFEKQKLQKTFAFCFLKIYNILVYILYNTSTGFFCNIQKKENVFIFVSNKENEY